MSKNKHKHQHHKNDKGQNKKVNPYLEEKKNSGQVSEVKSDLENKNVPESIPENSTKEVVKVLAGEETKTEITNKSESEVLLNKDEKKDIQKRVEDLTSDNSVPGRKPGDEHHPDKKPAKKKRLINLPKFVIKKPKTDSQPEVKPDALIDFLLIFKLGVKALPKKDNQWVLENQKQAVELFAKALKVHNRLDLLIALQGGLSTLVRDDDQWVKENQAEAIKLFVEAIKNRDYLDPIIREEVLLIEALTTRVTPETVAEVCQCYFDKSFTDLTSEQEIESTPEIFIQGYEIVRGLDFKKMFHILADKHKLDAMCLTQSQIIKFCAKYPNLLRTGAYGNLFLYKKGSELAVACVRVLPKGLHLSVKDFNDDFNWDAKFLHRVFVPFILV